jgi:hypothetical protein
MMMRSPSKILAVVSVLAGVCGTAVAQETRKPLIYSATASADQSMLFVSGANFGSSPIVTVGGLSVGAQVDAIGSQLTCCSSSPNGRKPTLGAAERQRQCAIAVPSPRSFARSVSRLRTLRGQHSAQV